MTRSINAMAVSSILCALICSSVEAGPTDSITIGDYTWTYGYYNYGTYRDARIMGVSPAKGDITIPDSFSQGGKDVIVTEIVRILNYDELQIENNELTSVTIPASVNIIRVGAFTNCTGLTTMMVLCDYFSGKEISGCRNLTNLTIGKWLNEFERNYSDSSRGGLSKVFPDSYRNIRQVAILDSVTKIGSKAFYNFSAMTKVDIPNSVTSIGDFAFCGCRSLSSIIIPNSVTDIGLYAFNEAGLECVTLPEGLTNINHRLFRECSLLTNVVVPNSVIWIGAESFSGCCSLSDISIPNNVESIYSQAFSGCVGLTNITFGSGVRYIGDEAFIGCSGLEFVTIPASVTNIANAFTSCGGLKNIAVEDGNDAYCSINGMLLTRDGKTLVQGVNGDITIPDGVTNIMDFAFSGRYNLTSVTIPGSVKRIGRGAFYECSGLTSVTIPDSVMSIEEDAFGKCNGLTSVIFKGDRPDIGRYAFDGVDPRCTAYVKRSSTGGWWGVEIPGMWKGINIQYLTPDVEISAANAMGSGIVNIDEELPDGVEVASGVTVVVNGESLDADALAEKITPLPHEAGQSASLFKVAASTAFDGSVSLAVVLDEDAVALDETVGEIVGAANVARLGAATDGESVSMSLSSAKSGLYYGIAAANDLSQLDAAAARVLLVRAGAQGVTVSVAKPTGNVAFFKVIVSDRAR